MNKVLFAVNYPFTPGQVDALVLVSASKLTLPAEVVLLPPYPEGYEFKEDTGFYRTIEVLPEDLPEGVEAVEVSPESFLAVGTANPNKPALPGEESVEESMRDQGFLKRPRVKDDNPLDEEEEDED